MNRKWFNSAAVEGSGFENIADSVIAINEITNENLKRIDLLFVKNKADFFSTNRFTGSTVISEKEVLPDMQEKFILENPGETFLSRIGHDFVNILSPFEHFEYLDEQIIFERVKHGIRFGRQINIIGHLLQKTQKSGNYFYNFDEFMLNLKTLAGKSGLNFKINNLNNHRIDTIPSMNIMNSVVDEILSNCKMHGNGKFEVIVLNSREIVFTNQFEGSFNFERPKAQLRCPFVKNNQSKGSGLGLFIISLSSVRGGFDWDISVKDSCFSLSLVF